MHIDLFWKQLLWVIISIVAILILIKFDWRSFINHKGIILGIYIEFSVLLLVLFLLVTTLQMHQYWKITDQMLKMGEQINFYKNISLIGALLMLLAIPLPWVLSLF